MNSCARTIIAAEPSRRRRRAGAAWAVLALATLLSACGGKQVRPGIASAPVVVAPTPARPSPPPTPVVAPAPVLPPRNFDQEKARRKAELARNPQGSLAPAEVGYYLDVLLGRIKQHTGKSLVATRQGQRIVITLPARSGFDVGSVALTPGLRQSLSPLSRVLVEYRRVLVSVRVSADQSIIGANNPRLTDQRSQAIHKYLIAAGVPANRLLIAPAPLNRTAPAKPGIVARGRIDIELEPVVRLAARPKSRS